MEFRKIIKFGNSSHIVSLPKNWLEKNHLNKGDVIYFSENGNNELILSPQVKEISKEQKEISIDTTNKDIDSINREIISAYIRDYNIIKIHGADLKKKAEAVRNCLHGLVALEIMEQTKDIVIAKDFLNISNTSLRDLIRKLDIIVRAMMADTKLCVKEDHSDSIINRDLDVNRLTFLTFRVIKKALKDPEVAKAIDVGPINLVDSWRLANSLEGIADEAKRAARCIILMKSKEKNRKEFLQILDEIEKAYLDIMKAYHTVDIKLAFNVATKIKLEVMPRCNKLLEYSENSSANIRCMEKLKGIANHISDICRVIYMSED